MTAPRPAPAGAPPVHRPVAGIVTRLVAVAALGLMFALVKLAAGRGVNIVESAFYRHAFALPLVLVWVGVGAGFRSLRTSRIGGHAARATVGLTAMVLNFLGMIMLPLTEATVIGFTTPLFATLLAALLLGEPTGRYRWAALMIGFAGVMVVVQPGQLDWADGAHNIGALIALAGALATASVTILIRQLGATEAAATTVFWFTALSLVPLSLLMLGYGQAHDMTTWALLVGIGLSGGTAQLCLTAALRFAPVAVVLPMDYAGLLWATLFGWLIFGTLPLATTIIGAPLIILSGLIILWREHVRGRAMLAARGADQL